MYGHLVKIGLDFYLDKSCGGKNWHEESWLINLDAFIGSLSEKNLSTLKNKFSKEKTQLQNNDIVHEVMIMCAYHPDAILIPEQKIKTCDLFDESLDLNIEVKTLNESREEQVRHEENKIINQVGKVSDVGLVNRKENVIAAIKKKCSEKIYKAIDQIPPYKKGKIYLVYDYDHYFKNLDGTRSHAPLSKKEVHKVIEYACRDFLTSRTRIEFEIIFHGDLKDKIARN